MADAWIATHAAGFARREMAVFAIAAPDDRLLGAISLRLDSAHDRAEMGYWIGLPYWGQGYATEAAMRLRDFGFDELAVHRLHAAYLPRNPASGRVMSKIGMRFEGLHRSHYFKDGQFEDVIEFAMLRTDARPSGAGLEIGPGTPHHAINLSTASVNFLVTSQPPSHGDRVIDHSDRERHG